MLDIYTLDSSPFESSIITSTDNDNTKIPDNQKIYNTTDTTKMFAGSIPFISLLALATSVAAQRGNILTGTQCCYDGWQHCQDQGSWGCIQIDGGGPNCVNQTPNCDDACGNYGYTYQKDK